jgi:non-ribosomal peptide synthetase component F
MINLHHIIADGMSAGLLMREVGALYSALALGSNGRLPELPVQYGDVALWQQQRPTKEVAPAAQIAFWTRRLGGTLPRLNLPIDHPRPIRKSFRGANVFFDVPAALGGELRNLAARERCTVFMALLAAFQVLLHRYSGTDDLIVVTPVANRSATELQPLIGNFLNLLPLRCDVAGDPTFVEVLRRSRETTLDAFSNGDVPLETVLEHVQLEGPGGGAPMFQVMLQLLPADRPSLGGLAVSNFRFELGFAQLDLSLHFYEEAGGSYRGRFEYCTDLFRAGTIQALTANFQSLLCAMVENPSQQIGRVPLAVPETRREPPSAEMTEESRIPCQAPRTPNEKIVLAAFRHVLKRTNFGVFHNFFHLGGHSLAAARLMLQLRRESGLDLPLSILLERPTVQQLAEAMDMLSWAASARQVPTTATSARVEIDL